MVGNWQRSEHHGLFITWEFHSFETWASALSSQEYLCKSHLRCPRQRRIFERGLTILKGPRWVPIFGWSSLPTAPSCCPMEAPWGPEPPPCPPLCSFLARLVVLAWWATGILCRHNKQTGSGHFAKWSYPLSSLPVHHFQVLPTKTTFIKVPHFSNSKLSSVDPRFCFSSFFVHFLLAMFSYLRMLDDAQLNC